MSLHRVDYIPLDKWKSATHQCYAGFLSVPSLAYLLASPDMPVLHESSTLSDVFQGNNSIMLLCNQIKEFKRIQIQKL
jgi:hypothetical protein